MHMENTAIQNKQNYTLEIDGKTFQNFNTEGVFSVGYLEHLPKNHSVIKQSEEDEHSIRIDASFELKLMVDCGEGSINMNHNIVDLIDNSGGSITTLDGVDEIIIDLASVYLTAHH